MAWREDAEDRANNRDFQLPEGRFPFLTRENQPRGSQFGGLGVIRQVDVPSPDAGRLLRTNAAVVTSLRLTDNAGSPRYEPEVFDFDHSIWRMNTRRDDLAGKLLNYQSHPAIKAPVAV